MRELSLFTGAGGGLLGTKLLGWNHVGYVEFNEYCQKVIAQRIADGHLDRAPIFTDVREFVQSGAAEQYRGIADVVSGGFPCQPFSVAGSRKAEDDSRNMWPATADIIRIVRPARVLLENVPGLLGFDYAKSIFADLAEMGYVGRYGVISAADVGAPHKRERLWVIANAKCQRLPRSRSLGESSDTAQGDYREADRLVDAFQGKALPFVCRSHDGDANRVDRLKAIGNAQVPACVVKAWELLA